VVNPPRTVIIDSAGTILLSHEGYEPGTENIYEAKIREMLSLPALDVVVPESIEPKETIPCGECK